MGRIARLAFWMALLAAVLLLFELTDLDLSHTVVTMIVAWILIFCVVEVARAVHKTAGPLCPGAGTGGHPGLGP